MAVPQPGEYYYHYKHDPDKGITDHAYEIVDIAVHTETEELLVCYRPMYVSKYLAQQGGTIFVRPFSMFVESIDKDGQVIPRFQEIKDPNLIARLSESQVP